MKKYSQKDFIEKSKKIFGDKFDYSNVCYENSSKKVIITCLIHGDFLIGPSIHLNKKRGCPICNNFKYNLLTFIEKANEIHKYKYLYDKVIWKGVKTKIIITCKEHGDFKQSPDKHINAMQGCSLCSKRPRYRQYDIIKKAAQIHGNKYDYSGVVFKGMYKKINIICKIHGAFAQTPTNHINNKQGCLLCGLESLSLTKEIFIERSVACHKIKYDYSSVDYNGTTSIVTIICPKHGEFTQRAASHLNGANCPKCAGNVSLKQEMWLDMLNIDKKFRNKTIKIEGNYFKVDAFDSNTNTVYEFYGDYWHGNPQIYYPLQTNKHNGFLFEKLYNDTINRENKLKLFGFNIISIWEHEFNNKINITQDANS